MWLLPRLRLAFGRRPWLHPALVGAAALLVWWQAAALHADAVRARDAWGATRLVWVADATVAPGAAVRAHRDRYPAALVPGAAVTAMPHASIAGRDVTKGAVVVAADLADTRRTPAGWVVFAVPADGAPAVRFADGLAVFGGGHHICDGIARTVTVDRVEVAVPPECAAPVSAELIADQVVLARIP
jgi:hypothetical protein